MKRFICALALLSVAFSCNETPDTPTGEPTPEPDVILPAGEDGSLDYEVVNGNDGNGSETTAVITQSSSYTDPDGTVYECEPKAEIVLKAVVDTVFVKDIGSLTAVSDQADVTASCEGENPVTHMIRQSFGIGGQTVEVNLAYEVYTYVNSRKQSIEMPYIKLNNAEFGSTGSAEVKSTDAVRLSDISVRPLKSATRSIEVTDTTEYEVTARFSLEVETANLPATTKKTISFEVVYVGVVTETNTYPGAEYSYNLTDADGNPVENTGFTVEPNSSFELRFKQSSSYTDRNGAVTATPEAWTRIVTPDTLVVDNADELAGMLSEVSIETSSEVPEGNLPYYKLGEVTLDGEVAVAEVSSEGNAVVYKATATYKQKAIPVNFENGEELEFTYVVEYAGKVEVRLVDVEYEQEVIWEDAHDNIYTNSQIVITRKATYSDGTVDETKFYSTKNFVQYVTSNAPRDTSGEIEYNNYEIIKTVDSIIVLCATGVPDLENFSYDIRVGDNEFVNLNDYQGDSLWAYLSDYEGPEGNWSEYKHQETRELYNESVQTEGLYGKQFGFRSFISNEYIGEEYYAIRQYKIDLVYKDRFFCIDGKLFTVDPLEHTHRWSVETIETPNRGTCALRKLEADVTWLGRDFYYAVIDTVYVKQSSADSSQVASAAAASLSRPDSESRSGSPYVTAPEYRRDDLPGMSLSVQTVPGSVPYTVRTLTRPSGTRTTTRYEGIVSDLPLR